MDPRCREAAAVLRRGGLVAFPTETVYGLGADAENPLAVAHIFLVKGRPTAHPLIVHLPGLALLDEWARDVPPLARRLAERLWPGPLTLVLQRSDRVPDVVTGGQETVGLRVPSHPLALELLEELGGGVAAPSANRFGGLSPTTAEHVREDLGAAVDYVLDGGATPVGVESTIVDLSTGRPRLLRPGGVPRELLVSLIGGPLVDGAPEVRAPGTLPSHYAPRAAVELVAPGEVVAVAVAHAARGTWVAVLCEDEPLPPTVLRLRKPPSLEGLARSLYALLRRADAAGVEVVVASLPPESGLGLAIADRLRHAAAPRPGS